MVIERIDYYQQHIKAIKQAVEHDGVDLIGYLAWSPIDFFIMIKKLENVMDLFMLIVI
ncbi:MAG: family 1 glycosylhydrolase [Thomasclavelia ramosa]